MPTRILETLTSFVFSRGFLALYFTVISLHIVRWYQLRKKMPPGPLGLPFIGNSHQVPAVKPWRKFQAWNEQYGPVVSLFLGSTPVVVLGTPQAAQDLLDKRSEIYSSRPRFIMGGEILSDNKRGLMLPYGEEWRKFRKILHSGFHARKSEEYQPIQSLESKIMMHQILAEPKNYERHIQRYAASVVTSVTYGRRIDSVDEWVVRENMRAMDYLTSVNIPGKYIVESMPWLLNLPLRLQWFRKAPEAQRQRDVKFLMHLYDEVKSRMDEGTIADCLTSQTISISEKNGWEALDVAYAVSSPFGAGIETTAGTLSVFFLAMLHYPETMKKAQQEIDSVIGPERMPEFEHKDSLPYVNALINETLRWRPVAALGGSPHAVTSDDKYHGMYIPKGSTVFANLVGIMHDPGTFPDPDTFRPERFLETSDPCFKDFTLPFGFGRRICPGMHLARNSVFMNITRILWGFNILPKKDNRNRDVLPDRWNFSNGFNSRPISFECRIEPRSDKVVKCIEREAEMARSSFGSP
ncbi:cytochrome P450 family protein [Pleurotus pulmonarius]